MAEGLDEIGAAVPGLGLRRIGLDDAGREPERLPDRHGGETHVVGPAELVDLDRVPHGLERLEIGEDRVGILARDLGEEIVRHDRIERLAALADPEVHRAPEILGSPCPDAGLVVGGDVGRNDDAEGRRNGEPAGERDALGCCAADCAVQAGTGGVARNAISRPREIFAAFDGVLGRGREGRGDGRHAKRERERRRARHAIPSRSETVKPASSGLARACRCHPAPLLLLKRIPERRTRTSSRLPALTSSLRRLNRSLLRAKRQLALKNDAEALAAARASGLHRLDPGSAS